MIGVEGGERLLKTGNLHIVARLLIEQADIG